MTTDAWSVPHIATTPSGAGVLTEAEMHFARLRALLESHHSVSRLDRFLTGTLTSDHAGTEAPIAGGRLALLRTGPGTGLAARAVAGLEGALTTTYDEDLLLFAPGARPARSSLLDSLRRVATSVVREEPSAVVAISSAARDAGDGPTLLAQVRRLAGLPLSERCRVADDHWAVLLLQQLADQLGDALPRGCPLESLRGLPGELSADFIRTLWLWLQEDGDTLRTSQQMHLHVNTVRYRLRRVEAVSGLDLGDPAHRTLAWLTLMSQRAATGLAETNVRSMPGRLSAPPACRSERRTGSAS